MYHESEGWCHSISLSPWSRQLFTTLHYTLARPQTRVDYRLSPQSHQFFISQLIIHTNLFLHLKIAQHNFLLN
jgi:hypothetical protein